MLLQGALSGAISLYFNPNCIFYYTSRLDQLRLLNTENYQFRESQYVTFMFE